MRQVGMESDQAGDYDEFVAFVTANSRQLVRTADVLCATPDAADELMQATLTALHPSWARVEHLERHPCQREEVGELRDEVR